MSIRTRLLLSYIAMTVVPVVVIALIAAALGSVLKDASHAEDGNRGFPAFWIAAAATGCP